MVDVGKKIKSLRLQNGLTLEELASRSELSKGFLSQVERDLTSPSIATLADIVEALGLSLESFFKEERSSVEVFKPEDYFLDQQEGYRIDWIVPNAQKNDMEPIIIHLEKGAQSQVITPHEGEELAYVLSGKIELYFADYTYVLEAGDTFYLRGDQSHYLKGISTELASVIWVCSPPIF